MPKRLKLINSLRGLTGRMFNKGKRKQYYVSNGVYRKLKPQVPEKKIKMSSRAPAGVFESNPNLPSDQDKINGWSFVAPKYQNQQENLTSRLS